MVSVLKSEIGDARFPADVCIVVETAEERDVFAAALRRDEVAEP